jgi:hypothetical protein
MLDALNFFNWVGLSHIKYDDFGVREWVKEDEGKHVQPCRRVERNIK